MPVVAVAQRKGGSGKTTVAIHLAGEFARRGHQVCLVDADPQGSSAEWASPGRLEFDVHLDIVGNQQTRWLERVRALPHEFVIIDTPPSFGATFSAAIYMAQVALVPCGPSSLDLVATEQSVDRIRAIRKRFKRQQPRIVLVPVRIDPHTAEGQSIVTELSNIGEPVAPGLLYDMSYVRAFAMGESIATFASGKAADQQMKALVDTVIANVDGAETR